LQNVLERGVKVGASETAGVGRKKSVEMSLDAADTSVGATTVTVA
jgi:hypothetical protein